MPGLTLTLLLGCSGGGDDTSKTDDSGTGDPPMTEAELFAEVEGYLGSYSTWGQAAGLEGIVATPGGAHGEYVSIWYDDTALADLTSPADGATAFKEGYAEAAGAELGGITAMRYESGYGWFYAMWDPDQTLMDSGRPDMCVGCHEADATSGGFLADG